MYIVLNLWIFLEIKSYDGEKCSESVKLLTESIKSKLLKLGYDRCLYTSSYVSIEVYLGNRLLFLLIL